MPDLNQFSIDAQLLLLRAVGVAIFLGAIIGLDREATAKPAGLRTHMLVSGVAALLVGLGPTMVNAYAGESSAIRADPIRVIEAIITGVAVLGAGTIIRDRERRDVHGLTTVASLLMCAAVGVAIGLSQWIVGIGITVIVLVILRGVSFVERRWQQ